MITSAAQLDQWLKWILGSEYDDEYDLDPDPGEACRAMQDKLDGLGQAGPELVSRARKQYADGSDDNIEIDKDAGKSECDDGVWVQAWVWLRNEDKAAD
jgi:hypothetical protein